MTLIYNIIVIVHLFRFKNMTLHPNNDRFIVKIDGHLFLFSKTHPMNFFVQTKICAFSFIPSRDEKK